MTEFKLYNVEKKDLYASKSFKEKEKIRHEMVLMALDKGIKPAARFFKTYPSTVRKWVKEYNEKGIDGLKYKR